jgi:hypothetical protein
MFFRVHFILALAKVLIKYSRATERVRAPKNKGLQTKMLRYCLREARNERAHFCKSCSAFTNSNTTGLSD